MKIINLSKTGMLKLVLTNISRKRFALFLMLLSVGVKAQVHTTDDLAYMAKTFNGAWLVSPSKEILLVRAEVEGISILVDQANYFRDAVVTDINREEQSLTFEFEGRQFSLTRIGSSYLKFSSDAGILTSERTRRLSKQDHEVLDVWYNFKPDPCGTFNQHCDEENIN